MRGVFVGGGVCRSVDLQDATGTQATFNFLCLVVFQGDDHLVPSVVERCHGGFAFRGAGETTQAAGHAAAGEGAQGCTLVGSGGIAFGGGNLYRGANVKQRQGYYRCLRLQGARQARHGAVAQQATDG